MSEKEMLGRAFDNQPEPGMGVVMDKANGLAKQIVDANNDAAEANYRADHDPLTGLLNKDAWKYELGKRMERAKPGDLAILFIDLKDFKKANDGHGHEYGDKILKVTADILRSILRTDGVNIDVLSFEPAEEREEAGRLGGDEFAIILDLTPRKNTELSAEERTSMIKNRLMEVFGANEEIKASGVGMSVGEAVWAGQEVGELLKQADSSMYDHKQEQINEIGSYR